MVRVKSKRRSLLGMSKRRRYYGNSGGGRGGGSGGGKFPYFYVILSSIVVLQICTIVWLQSKSSAVADTTTTNNHHHGLSSSHVRRTRRVSTTTVTNTVDKDDEVDVQQANVPDDANANVFDVVVDDDVQRHGVAKRIINNSPSTKEPHVIYRKLDDDDNIQQQEEQEEPPPQKKKKQVPPPPQLKIIEKRHKDYEDEEEEEHRFIIQKLPKKPLDDITVSIPEFRRFVSPNYYETLAQSVGENLTLPTEQVDFFRSCYSLGPTIGNSNSPYPLLLTRPECQHKSIEPKTWWAHNTLDFPRSYCGILVLPGQTEQLPTDCVGDPPVTYLSADLHVPLDGYGMPPIVLELDMDDNKNEEEDNRSQIIELKHQDCDIPCQATIETCEDGEGEVCLDVEATFYVLNNAGTRPKDGIVFEYDITYPDDTEQQQQQEDAKHYQRLYQDRHYPVTYDFDQAAVPISTFSWSKYGGHSPPVDFEAMDKSIAFLGSEDCKRAKPYVEALMNSNYFSVVAFGQCAHNTDLPPSIHLDNSERDRNHLYKEYIFALIVEPTTAKDYIGEDVWEALHAGVVPIYYGASNIQQHVPPNSIINVASFETTEKLVEHLKNVAEDKVGYDAYHAWRHGAFPAELAQSFDFLRSNMYCRMCRFAYMKRYGLGWDHSEQIPLEPIGGAASRSIQCISQHNGMMARPFVESWFSPGGSSTDQVKTSSSEHACANSKETTQVHIGKQYSFLRRLVAHDGVFDFSIEDIKPKSGNTQYPLWFRIEGPGLGNEKGVDFNNVHVQLEKENENDKTTTTSFPYKGLYTSLVVQDDVTRMTLIASWATDKARSPNPGIMEMEVVPTRTPILSGGEERRKLRLIVEPVDPLRETNTSVYQLSPFAKMHMEDFLEPLALFYLKENTHQIME